MTILNLATNGHVGRVVADYTGKQVFTLECVVDQHFPGVYAFRAALVDSDGNTSFLEFMTRGIRLERICPGDIEEVCFASWPPV